MRSIGLTIMAGVLAVSVVNGQGNARRVSASLTPSQEVPAVSSPAQGTFVAEIDESSGAIDYTISFSGLQAPVRMSHIHFAQPGVNGAIMVWLCGTAGFPGPAGTPTCPQSGTVSGTAFAADIQDTGTQRITTGEFDELVAAMRNGVAYANVHTDGSPGGEIRGQVRSGGGHQ
jgi:CHRD domain